MIQALQPWMSAEDIGAGARWSPAIATQLEASDFGIVCLTPENLKAEWLHFEAGALAKSVEEGRVVPYLFDLSKAQVTGPLAQFQMKNADEANTLDLLREINAQMRPPMAAESLERAFKKWWPDLQEALSRIGPAGSEMPAKRSPEKMIEEVLELVRGLVRRAESVPANPPAVQANQSPEVTEALGRLRVAEKILRNRRGPLNSLQVSEMGLAMRIKSLQKELDSLNATDPASTQRRLEIESGIEHARKSIEGVAAQIAELEKNLRPDEVAVAEARAELESLTRRG